MKVLLLAGNTNRAKTYAQILGSKSNNQIEVSGLLFGFGEESEIQEPNIETLEYCRSNSLFVPELSEKLTTTFENCGWPYEMIETRDVNSVEVIEAIKTQNADLVVFAGYGGQILKSGHFQGHSNYLHMHPGELPNERGSTTIYYSLLNQRDLSVTAFYMTEKIDQGKNILCSSYPAPNKNANIDVYIDSIIRADCFYKALQKLLDKESFIESGNEDTEYYVIHPLLKHLALLSLK